MTDIFTTRVPAPVRWGRGRNEWVSESAYMRNVHPHGGQPGGVRYAFVNAPWARPADTLAEQVGGRGGVG